MKPIDLTKLQKKYKGLWVALSDNWQTVLGADKNIKKAHREALEKGHDNPIMYKVPERNIAYFGAQLNG